MDPIVRFLIAYIKCKELERICQFLRQVIMVFGFFSAL